jgi:hypothetical protein
MFMSMKGLKDVPLLNLKKFFKQLILSTFQKLQGSITLLLNHTHANGYLSISLVDPTHHHHFKFYGVKSYLFFFQHF